MYTSAFDIYRIGPGPSSAHTVAPMRAARRFVHALEADGHLLHADRVHVDLYGAVACAGRDQSTDRAIVAGLCGERPDAVDRMRLDSLFERVGTERALALAGRTAIAFDVERDVVFHVDKSFDYHSNAIRFGALDANGETLTTRLYFSTGDGDIVADSDASAGASVRVPFPFATAAELLAAAQKLGKKIPDVMRTNELALRSPAEVHSGLVRVAAAMRASIERGLIANGTLPGHLALPRRAATQAKSLAAGDPSASAWVAVYATAVAEENAAGGRIAAAPSNGAAGPVAAVLQQWRAMRPLDDDTGSVNLLLTAAAICHLLRRSGIKHAGCQGEVGVAAAMAAAGLACALGASSAQTLFAAERALEPHLNLTCDPVSGLVQQPCIERNARAAAIAVDAARLALKQPDPPRLALDPLLRSMVESARAMAGRYKHSSLGGVALNVSDC
jgi:L-serine dehydratase